MMQDTSMHTATILEKAENPDDPSTLRQRVADLEREREMLLDEIRRRDLRDRRHDDD